MLVLPFDADAVWRGTVAGVAAASQQRLHVEA
jgi:hypothetical protein